MGRRAWAVLAIVCVSGPAARAQVRLEYKPVEGASYRHELTMKVHQVMTLAGMDVTTDGETALVTTSANGKRRDDGTLPVAIAIASIRTKIGINGQEFVVDSADEAPKIDVPQLAFVADLVKALRGSSYTVVLDAKNAVKFVEGAEKNLAKVGDLPPQAAAELKSQFSVDRIKREFEQEHGRFPDGLVREGEPWERVETTDLGSGQSITLTNRYEYKGTVEKGGKPLDRIDVKALDVSYKMDPAADSPARVTKSDLKVASSEGTVLFDREAGADAERSEKYRITGDLTLVVKVNGEDKEYPAKLDLTIDTRTTSQRVPE